ncbi:hypothetical protein DW886_09030 [Enterocloster aldenensis]|uniref:L,D-transpeptidase family protein n=1 Tax=Enterocloster aldenensis TaxID=358742 RepID=UPI000E47FA1E|nr:hypothetical protein DW886_09030 [Enterocloster aldenensis]
MSRELDKKEGTSVQHKKENGQRGKSRSRAAFKERKDRQAKARTDEAQDRQSKARSEEAPGRQAKARSEEAQDRQAKARSDEAPGRPRPVWGRAAAVCLVAAAAICVGGYIYHAVGYRDAYLPHTVINGMDVSGRTASEVKEMMASGVKDYSLVMRLRGGGQEIIYGADMGLHTVFDGSLEEIIRQQNPYAWPRYLLKGPSYDIQTMITYDEAALEKGLESLDCFKTANIVVPSDAYLSDYVNGEGYSVVPETEGNELDLQLVKAAAGEGVRTLTPELDLEALGCYREPRIRSGNSSLVAARDARNRYVNMTVTYTFGSVSEVLDGSTIHQWLLSEGDSVTLNRDMIGDYVKNLASRYNTAYKKRPFKTSYGQTVEVSGFYGWRINQAAETEELIRILEAGESVVREPVYSQTAASHDGADYGGTYAEVNLTAQHLFFYKDGQKILESDFVSGNVSKGHTTPPGIFALTYKQRDAVLKGEGYASPVKFWMPFNGGIGFHDASWRSSFGGSIYKTGGSHGCVNMPYAAAKELFENVYAGMPVICYELPGTESSRSSTSSGKAPAPTQAPPSQTPPAQTPPAQTPPVQTPPVQTPPVQTPPAQTPPAQTAPSQPPGPAQSQPAAGTQPQVTINPVGQSAPAATEGAQPSKPMEGYGPAFQTPHTGEEGGPGVG